MKVRERAVRGVCHLNTCTHLPLLIAYILMHTFILTLSYPHTHTLTLTLSHPHKDDEKARREALEKKLEDDKLKSKKKKKRLM